MDDPVSLESFIDKWRARWPEWSALLAFLPAAQRPSAAAWFALLQELQDAAWGGSDPTPGLAKLAWWQEELGGWAKGARRHPLGAALQPLGAPWQAFGHALAALPATRDPAPGADEAALRTFAAGLLACESALFGGRDASDADVAAMARALRAERALARGDADAARALEAAPAPPWRAPTRPRRLQATVVNARLRGLASGARVALRPSLRLLLAGWRAARGG